MICTKVSELIEALALTVIKDKTTDLDLMPNVELHCERLEHIDENGKKKMKTYVHIYKTLKEPLDD